MDHPTAHTNGDFLAGLAEVHQAAGMLTVQLQIGIPDALTRLRAHAVATDRPVLDVARDIIAHRLHLPADAQDGPTPGAAPEH